MANGSSFDNPYTQMFAQTAHDAMIQTLREMAQQPLQDAEIAQKEQSIKASKSEVAQSEDIAPVKKQDLQAKILWHQGQTSKLIDAANGNMTTQDLLREKKNVDDQLKGIPGILLDDQTKAQLQQLSDFYGSKLKAPGGGEKPKVKGGGKTASKQPAGASSASGFPKFVIYQGQRYPVADQGSLDAALGDGAKLE